MADEILERWRKVYQKSSFFLMARPSPPPLNGPAIKRITFFAASHSRKSICPERKIIQETQFNGNK